MITLADPTAQAVTLAVDAQGLALDSRSAQLCFQGDWGIRGDDGVRVFGLCRQGPERRTQRASLQVDPCPGPGNEARWSVTLRDAAGRVVLGPVELQRVRPSSPPGPR